MDEQEKDLERTYKMPLVNKTIVTALVAGLLIFSHPFASAAAMSVTRISDGDTITLLGGEKVRLLQIDTPEIFPAECYGTQAHAALIKLLGKSQVDLESDSASGDRDQFGRLLRYLKVGKVNINVKLVELGAATPYFYNGEKGKYSKQLLKAAEIAKKKKLGLWGACPGTKLDPLWRRL